MSLLMNLAPARVELAPKAPLNTNETSKRRVFLRMCSKLCFRGMMLLSWMNQ